VIELAPARLGEPSPASSSPRASLPTPAVRVAPLAAGDARGWQEWEIYVRQAPGASFFHLPGWRRAVENTFGHRSHYLAARRGEELVGVLPLFALKSLLFGRSLVSLPFAVGGGALADDPEVAAALLRGAVEEAERRQVDYLELRSERPLSPDLLTKDLYVTFRADLRESEEALLKRMERKRRQMMSYAARAGYTFRVAGPEELPLFFRLFAENMRHHGTPIYPRRFLAEILAQHPGEANLFFVSQGDRTLAGTLNLLFRGVLMPFYAGHAPGVRPRGVDDFLYLAILRWGRENGYTTFDFGRSKRGTGAYQFKARWGMEEVPLAYQYHLVRARELPNVSPANPRYAAFIAAWKRLPLPVALLLGPSIVKRVP
jgi:FemAB-related protein (PEP-CTERM system-associated)